MWVRTCPSCGGHFSHRQRLTVLLLLRLGPYRTCACGSLSSHSRPASHFEARGRACLCHLARGPSAGRRLMPRGVLGADPPRMDFRTTPLPACQCRMTRPRHNCGDVMAAPSNPPRSPFCSPQWSADQPHCPSIPTLTMYSVPAPSSRRAPAAVRHRPGRHHTKGRHVRKQASSSASLSIARATTLLSEGDQRRVYHDLAAWRPPPPIRLCIGAARHKPQPHQGPRSPAASTDIFQSAHLTICPSPGCASRHPVVYFGTPCHRSEPAALVNVVKIAPKAYQPADFR